MGSGILWLWQIEVDKQQSREKMAFITTDRLDDFKVMPFGFCTAPATFQRVMDTMVSGLKWQTCLVYLDDVVMFARTFEEHIAGLKQVLQAARLTLKPQMC